MASLLMGRGHTVIYRPSGHWQFHQRAQAAYRGAGAHRSGLQIGRPLVIIPPTAFALGFGDLRNCVVTADLLRGNAALEVENRVVLRLHDLLYSLYGSEGGLNLLDNRTGCIRGLGGGKSPGPHIPEVLDAVERTPEAVLPVP